MHRSISRSTPYLPRYQSVSPARSPHLESRRFSSPRSTSQPSQRIVYIDNAPSRVINSYHVHHSPSPRRTYRIHLCSNKTKNHLTRVTRSHSACDINSSHVYTSQEDIFVRSLKESVSRQVGSSEDVYHAVPFFPDVTPSESGVSFGDWEEGSTFGGEDDNVSQHSFGSSSAFCEVTADSELDKCDSDNFSGPDYIGEKALGVLHENVSDTNYEIKRRRSRRSQDGLDSPDYKIVGPVSDAKSRKGEPVSLSSQTWDLNKLQTQSEALTVLIPESEISEKVTGDKVGSRGTPLAHSTPHVSPRGPGESKLCVMASWHADSMGVAMSGTESETSTPARTPSGHGNDSRYSSRFEDSSCNSSCSEDNYSDVSNVTASSPVTRRTKLVKKHSDKSVSSKKSFELHALKQPEIVLARTVESGSGRQRNNSAPEEVTQQHYDRSPHTLNGREVLQTQQKLTTDTSDKGEQAEKHTAGNEWWASYGTNETAGQKSEVSSEKGNIEKSLLFRRVPTEAKPPTVNIPLITAGKHGQEKLRKLSQMSPPLGSPTHGSPPGFPSDLANFGENEKDRAQHLTTHRTDVGHHVADLVQSDDIQNQKRSHSEREDVNKTPVSINVHQDPFKTSNEATKNRSSSLSQVENPISGEVLQLELPSVSLPSAEERVHDLQNYVNENARALSHTTKNEGASLEKETVEIMKTEADTFSSHTAVMSTEPDNSITNIQCSNSTVFGMATDATLDATCAVTPVAHEDNHQQATAQPRVEDYTKCTLVTVDTPQLHIVTDVDHSKEAICQFHDSTDLDICTPVSSDEFISKPKTSDDHQNAICWLENEVDQNRAHTLDKAVDNTLAPNSEAPEGEELCIGNMCSDYVVSSDNLDAKVFAKNPNVLDACDSDSCSSVRDVVLSDIIPDTAVATIATENNATRDCHQFRANASTTLYVDTSVIVEIGNVGQSQPLGIDTENMGNTTDSWDSPQVVQRDVSSQFSVGISQHSNPDLNRPDTTTQAGNSLFASCSENNTHEVNTDTAYKNPTDSYILNSPELQKLVYSLEERVCETLNTDNRATVNESGHIEGKDWKAPETSVESTDTQNVQDEKWFSNNTEETLGFVERQECVYYPSHHEKAVIIVDKCSRLIESSACIASPTVVKENKVHSSVPENSSCTDPVGVDSAADLRSIETFTTTDKKIFLTTDKEGLSTTDKDGLSTTDKEGLSTTDKEAFSIKDSEALAVTDKEVFILSGSEAVTTADTEIFTTTDSEAFTTTDKGIFPTTDKQTLFSIEKEVFLSTDKKTIPSADTKAFSSTGKESSISTDKEAFSSSDKEAFPSTDKDALLSTDKEAFPSIDKEAFPSTGKEAFLTTDKEALSSAGKETFSLTDKESFLTKDKETFPSTDKEAFHPTDKEGFFTTDKEALPSKTEETFPLTDKEEFLITDKEAFLTTDKETFPSTDKESFLLRDKKAFLTTGEESYLTTDKETFQSTIKEAFPSTVKETFLTTDKETFASTVKEAFPSTDKEAFPSTDKEAFPSSDKESFPSLDKEPFLTIEKEAFPSTDKETFLTQDKEPFPIVDKKPFSTTDTDVCSTIITETLATTSDETLTTTDKNYTSATAGESYSNINKQTTNSTETISTDTCFSISSPATSRNIAPEIIHGLNHPALTEQITNPTLLLSTSCLEGEVPLTISSSSLPSSSLTAETSLQSDHFLTTECVQENVANTESGLDFVYDVSSPVTSVSEFEAGESFGSVAHTQEATMHFNNPLEKLQTQLSLLFGGTELNVNVDINQQQDRREAPDALQNSVHADTCDFIDFSKNLTKSVNEESILVHANDVVFRDELNDSTQVDVNSNAGSRVRGYKDGDYDNVTTSVPIEHGDKDGDYDSVTTSVPIEQQLYTRPRHLHLLHYAQTKVSDLWVLQEETESAMNTPSPKQPRVTFTNDESNSKFHSTHSAHIIHGNSIEQNVQDDQVKKLLNGHTCLVSKSSIVDVTDNGGSVLTTAESSIDEVKSGSSIIPTISEVTSVEMSIDADIHGNHAPNDETGESQNSSASTVLIPEAVSGVFRAQLVNISHIGVEDTHIDVSVDEDNRIPHLNTHTSDSGYSTNSQTGEDVTNNVSSLDALSASLKQFNITSVSSSVSDSGYYDDSLVRTYEIEMNSDEDIDTSSYLPSHILDVSAASTSITETPTRTNNGAVYTCTGTAEIKETPLNDIQARTPETDFRPIYKKAVGNNKLTNAKIQQFEKILYEFNKGLRTSQDISDFLFFCENYSDYRDSSGSSSEELYKHFTNSDSEKEQNHTCITVEDENMNTFRFKRYLKKSHAKRNNGRKILRFLSKLSCVSETMSSPIDKPSEKVKIADRFAQIFSTDSMPNSKMRISNPILISSTSFQLHDILNSSSKEYNTKGNTSFDSLRTSADSAYSSLSDPTLGSLSSPMFRHTPGALDSVSSVFNLDLTSSDWGSPDNVFSNTSDATLRTTFAKNITNKSIGHDRDAVFSSSNETHHFHFSENEIDGALLNMMRYGHVQAELK